ncbi:MAG: hypothetical protein K2Q17_07420 [Nitrospiraceae bacterium]|nr:hypothetical protein [Nitrospiraceae bacterium]
MLGETRDILDHVKATPEGHRKAFDALYAAEGSDWFWWFGEDQASDTDAEFDDLFRDHLKTVYRAVGRKPPAALDQAIVPHTLLWTFTRPIASIRPEDRLTIRTNCAGRVIWTTDPDEPWRTEEMIPAGGVMAAMHRYGVTLGPFPSSVRAVAFRFQCARPGCCGTDLCCRGEGQRVEVLGVQDSDR